MPLVLREKDLDVLRAALRRHPCVREARLFGSRAAGAARRASDVDLAIDAPGATPAEWSDLREALENAPIIYELDIVRCDQASARSLRSKIAREGIVIYSAA